MDRLMETSPRRSRISFKMLAYGLGVALAVAAGALAWIGTHSFITSAAGAGLPLLFIISTVVFSRDTPLQ